MRKKICGFTLFELIMSATLAGITLACIIQFFLTQLNQYRLIAGNNQLNENLRIFSKFFEKDTHNSIEFYVFDDLAEALAAKKGDAIHWAVTPPKVGNCVLFVTERGMVEGGRGTLYFVGASVTLDGVVYWPLYRSIVSFTAQKKISETEDTLSKLPLGYIKSVGESFSKRLTDADSKTGIFYAVPHKRYGRNADAKYPHIAGCRHGIYVGTILAQPGLKGNASATPINFCFYSRNPRF